MLIPEHRGGYKLVYEEDLLVRLEQLMRVLLFVPLVPPLLLLLLLLLVVADVGDGDGAGVAITTLPIFKITWKLTGLLLSLKLPGFGANLMFPRMQKRKYK